MMDFEVCESVSEFMSFIEKGYKAGKLWILDLKLYKEIYNYCLNNINSNTLYVLGFIYYNGMLGEESKNLAKAIDCFKRAAYSGDIRSAYQMGVIYYNGEIVEKDYKEAFKYLKIAADGGDGEASNAVGDSYNDGIGVKRNTDKAAEYYHKAIDNGNTKALSSLGLLALDSKEYDLALNLFHTGSKMHNARAAFELYKIYMEGKLKEHDEHRAMKHLIRASNDGYAEACYIRGIRAYFGDDVFKDQEAAYSELKFALNRGYSKAAVMLGYMHEFGIGREKSLKKAIKCYLLSADEVNDPYSCLKLSYQYLSGEYLDQDKKRAFDYLRKSSDNGSIEGTFKLAKYYENKKDYNNAFSLYQKGMDLYHDKLNTLAYYDNRCKEYGRKPYNIVAFVKEELEKGSGKKLIMNVSRCYYQGIGVEKDEEKAVELLKSLAKEGYESAITRLGTMYVWGDIVKRSLDTAFNCFKEAADLGGTLSSYLVSLFYFMKLDENNLEEYRLEGLKYLKAAANNNFDKALILLAKISFMQGDYNDCFINLSIAQENCYDGFSQIFIENYYSGGVIIEEKLAEAREFFNRINPYDDFLIPIEYISKHYKWNFDN